MGQNASSGMEMSGTQQQMSGSENRQQQMSRSEIPQQGSAERPTMTPEYRAILWEVNIARGCLDSFTRMLQAHAIVLSLLVTVNFIGFLQPPKGWNNNTGFMYGASKAVKVFSVANSLSLFIAISGLLFYIYCSHATIVSLAAVSLPTRHDQLGLKILIMLRAALRKLALPAVKRRCSILFSCLASSLMCCIVAYISAGIASLPPKERFVGVILPSIPGCVLVLFFLNIAASKLVLELDFDKRFEVLWKHVAEGIPQREVKAPPQEVRDALDPLPPMLSWYYYKSPSAAEMPDAVSLRHNMAS